MKPRTAADVNRTWHTLMEREYGRQLTEHEAEVIFAGRLAPEKFTEDMKPLWEELEQDRRRNPNRT